MIDIHTHLNYGQIKGKTAEIIKKCSQLGINKIVNASIDKNSILETIELTQKYESVFWLLGFDRDEAENFDENFLEFCLEKEKNNPKIIGVGEIGLDFFYQGVAPKSQEEVFIKQLLLAKKYQLPVEIHCRSAEQRTWEILQATDNNIGLMHCYTGDLSYLSKFLDRGMFVSISGIVTFTKSDNVREILKYTPLDRIFIESDAPFLAPQSQRGKPNSPAFITETYQTVANIKKISLEELKKQVRINFYNLFKK